MKDKKGLRRSNRATATTSVPFIPTPEVMKDEQDWLDELLKRHRAKVFELSNSDLTVKAVHDIADEEAKQAIQARFQEAEKRADRNGRMDEVLKISRIPYFDAGVWSAKRLAALRSQQEGKQ